MIDVYRKIFSLLEAGERRRFWLLSLMMIAMALVEMVGISSVLVLLQVLSDPSSVAESRVFSAIFDMLGFSSIFAFQVCFALAVTALVLIGLVVKASGTYALVSYSNMLGYSISSRLLSAYMHQPYGWFLNRNSAEVGKNVLGEVDRLVSSVLTPLFRLTASAMLVAVIVGFLLLVDPVVTSISFGIIGGSYALIYLKLREKLRRTGEEMMRAFADRFKVSQEATGGIKDVKLLGLEDDYTRIYRIAAHRSAKGQATVGIISELPRFALEGITFAALLGIILLLLLRSGGNIADIVPLLGILAFSVMRLLPALQQIYHALATIRGGLAVLDEISTDYASAMSSRMPSQAPQPALHLEHSLELSGIKFTYAQAARPALLGLDVIIPARTTVGIVGGTGAGKTTLVDVVLGLLTPDGGEIRVDGTLVTPANIRAWQKTLGYVPQSIFLTDDTIAANIAFGVPNEQIDMAAVERAARAAALHDFVKSDLADGYKTIVGERGVRLSGGQRQRIGIARALYRDPTLLIMDEATSALDNITERVVMEAVQNIRADKTIILIAHRLSTVRSCDIIFLMDKGRIAARGTYDQLVADNETFRRMATH
ncbi:ABC transporter ATP-binding protein [Tabrizicola sp. BL-A-41-H6]|uniref:ABC transporter ATP-binding protein n=1 Tax=Tabrizicola sp. BL-A-41-H6 TaxID=3421107 RepID=UPI003D67DA0B